MTKNESQTVTFSPRIFPIVGVSTWWITFLSSLGMSIYFNHQDSGLLLPYISDCAKESPEV